jgi:hypothetical protein
MTKDEALKLALETLEQIQEGCNNVIADKLHSDAVDLAKLVRKDCNKPIDAIRKSLAQPEQKPVAWMRANEDCSDCIVWEQTENHTIPLYTASPQREWVGLTEEERDHFEGLHLYAARNQVEAWIEGVPAFIDAIEAKLREKNG